MTADPERRDAERAELSEAIAEQRRSDHAEIETVTLPTWLVDLLFEAAQHAHYDRPPVAQQVEVIREYQLRYRP